MEKECVVEDIRNKSSQGQPEHLEREALEYCLIMTGDPNDDELLIDGQ